MPHVVDLAPTGRAKCRGCGQKIIAGERRFGERVPNPFDEKGGDTTHWFHVVCAALTRPESFLETVRTNPESVPDKDWLEREASLGATHRRLSRLRTVERAPTGRATCRSCREIIPKDEWRVALAYYEDGRFVPSGYIHIRCTAAYVETTDVIGRLRHFSPGLTDDDFRDIHSALGSS